MALPRGPPDLPSLEAKQLCMRVPVVQVPRGTETTALCGCTSLASPIARLHPMDQTVLAVCLQQIRASPDVVGLSLSFLTWIIIFECVCVCC